MSSGSAAAADSSSQPSVTSRKPSRGLSSRRKRQVAAARMRPTGRGDRGRGEELRHRPSPKKSEQPDRQQVGEREGGEQQPQHVRDGEHAVSPFSALPAEQPLDRLEVATVGQEQDDVIVGERCACRGAP